MNHGHYKGTARKLLTLDHCDRRDGCDYRGNPTRTASIQHNSTHRRRDFPTVSSV